MARWQRLIATWHDRLIKPGSEWKDVIDANLEHAKIMKMRKKKNV